MTFSFKAGLLLSDPATKQLSPDKRPGTIRIEPLDDSVFSFTFEHDSGSEHRLELVLAHGDASFHHIESQGQVIGLKLASSGTKLFFWLQNSTDSAAIIVSQLNTALKTQQLPSIAALIPAPSEKKSAVNMSMFSKLASGLSGLLGRKKVSPGQVLTVDSIMEVCSAEDLEHLHQFFPEGYAATTSDLRTIITSPYFQQAMSVLVTVVESESASSFMAQFRLLEKAGEYPVGFDALLRALLKKHAKQ